jgi:hypothetical protein
LYAVFIGQLTLNVSPPPVLTRCRSHALGPIKLMEGIEVQRDVAENPAGIEEIRPL